jgi:ABC-type tungstate transport system substrate-binding protein
MSLELGLFRIGCAVVACIFGQCGLVLPLLVAMHALTQAVKESTYRDDDEPDSSQD